MISDMVGSGSTNFMGISGVEMISTTAMVVAMERNSTCLLRGETVASNSFTHIAISAGVSGTYGANLSHAIGGVEMIQYMATNEISIEWHTTRNVDAVDQALDAFRPVPIFAYSTSYCGSNFIGIGCVKMVGS